MKLLFTLIACTIFINVAAQSLNEKWVLTPVKNSRQGMGRLDLSFPVGVEWSVDVYNSNNKFITNRSFKDMRNAEDKMNYYELPAGIYKIKFNTVIIENVPVQQGQITRIKAGILDVKNPGRWELRNETGKKFYTSGTIQKNLALPVGKYQVKENAGVRLVEINDQFSSAAEMENTQPVETPLWEITYDHTISPGMSRVVVVIPDFGPVNLPAGGTVSFPEIKCDLSISKPYENYNFSCTETPKEILPGSRNTGINDLSMGPVTYEAGKQTRLKLGFLPISLKGEENEFAGLENYFELGEVPGKSYKSWKLKSVSNNSQIEGNKGGIYAFPAGEYILTKTSIIENKDTYSVIIPDGKFAIIKRIN